MTTPQIKKMLLIGWDAADWKIITPLLEKGEMPNLDRFLSDGVMGNLATLQPVLSPMLWTSIATGKRAHKHGIHGFSEPDPEHGTVRPVTNLGRTSKAIWNILQQNGKRCNVIGWWPSHPAEPINGVMVSDFYHKAKGPLDKPWPMRPGTVHPPRLIEPLKKLRIHPWELDEAALLPFVPNFAEIDQKNDKRLMNVAKTLAEAATINAAATAVMQLEDWDFMAVYFDAIDHFCHGFMCYHPPRLEWVEEKEFELYKEVVNSAYRFHDMMLGVQMELAGPETTMMIVSDHGFHPDHLRPKELPNEPAGPAEEHRPFGVFAMRGPGIKRDELVFGSSLLDVTPTILHGFGLPLGRDMDGKVLLQAFQDPQEIQWIDSWETVTGDTGEHPADRRADPVDAQEALDQLVELGYIEAPDANQQVAVENTVKELRYNLARDYFDAQHIPQASEIFQQLWDDHSDESRFGIKLFDCYMALDNTEAARSTLEQIISQKKQYAEAAATELKTLQDEMAAKKADDWTEGHATARVNCAVKPVLMRMPFSGCAAIYCMPKANMRRP